MRRSLATRLLFALTASVLCVSAQAAMIWNESIDGDLSNDGLAPTALTFASGSNVVRGATGNADQGERDYFSFTVPVGTALTSMTLLPGSFVSGGSSFIALQAGPQVTTTPSGAGVENLLGFMHYGTDRVGTDLLPDLAFGRPNGLSAGTYSVWLQELGSSIPYSIDFQVTPVPLPSALVLLLGGLLAGLTIARPLKGGQVSIPVARLRQ